MQDAERPHTERNDKVWKRYRNAELGYCVSYPARWAKGDAFDGSGLYVRTWNRQTPNSTGAIDVGPVNLPSDAADSKLKPVILKTADLDEGLAEHIAGLKKFVRAERMEVLTQQHLTVQGSEALYAKDTYYDPLERKTWVEEVVFVQRSGVGRNASLFRLELQCPPDRIDRFEPVFAYLVNSLEFDCK